MNDKEFEKTYILFYKELYLYALSLCKNHHLAEEIVSDTFYKAFVTLDDNNSNIKFWLLRVCKNLVIDIFRNEKKKTFISIDELNLGASNSVIDSIIKKEDDKKLYNAISKLESPYKDATFMFYFLNMPIKEIAILINSSEGATLNILYRARKKLLKVINIEEVYDEL